MTSTSPAHILVCYHKPGELLKSQLLRPIHVGRERSDENLKEMPGDNTGENISARNKNYCELTALYWAWKNVDAEYYGLMHYRRVFDFTGRFDGTRCYSLEESVQKELGLDDRKLLAAIDRYDVILPTIVDTASLLGSGSVRDQYCHEHLGADLDLLRAAIQAKAPHTLEDFDAVFAGQKAYFYNMFVMRSEIFRQYAPWLFVILFEVESQIDLRDRDDYQKRVFGFMAERLLTVFIHHYQRAHGLRKKELPVVFISEESPPGLRQAFQVARRRYLRLRIRRDSFHLKFFAWEFRRGRAA